MGTVRTTLGPLTVAAAAAAVALVAGVPTVVAAGVGGATLAVWVASFAATHMRWTILALRARAQLADPTALPLAGIVLIALLVATRSPLEAAAASLAVLGVRVAAGVALARPHVDRPRLPAGSASAIWLARAEIAVEATRQLRPGPGPLAVRFAETREAAQEALFLVRRLGAHEATVSALLTRIDGQRVAEDQRRLEAERDNTTSAPIRAEIQRAIAALNDQAAARARLVASDETLVARMRTAALGLEGLVARLAEIIAAAQGGADATAQLRVSELADELDALRAGLSEADSIGQAIVQELHPTNDAMEVGR